MLEDKPHRFCLRGRRRSMQARRCNGRVMWDLQLPWWWASSPPFDLVVVMLLAEAVSNSLNGVDESLVGGLIAAATLIALDLLRRERVPLSDVERALRSVRYEPPDMALAVLEADGDIRVLPRR